MERGSAIQPWSFGLARLSPLPTWITGLIFGTALLAFFVLLELLSGRPQALLSGVSPTAAGCTYLLGDYRIGIVGIIALAYSLTARYKLTEWTNEATSQLGRPDVANAETLASSRWWGFIPGLVGIALCLGAAIDIAERDVEWTRDYWILPHVLSWGWCIPFGWVGGRLIYSVFANSVIISRVARSVKVTDLGDTAPIEAAVRHGSQSALISLMFLGILSVHFVDPGLNLRTIVVVVVLFVVGTVISALPTVGIVQSYYDKRDEELEALRSEIAIEEKQLLEKDPDYEPGRIGDLVSMEQRLAGWKVTVFRLSTFARLALYVFIGFLSWIGAAAVSVVVEMVFGL
jgi:hypothetical protein